MREETRALKAAKLLFEYCNNTECEKCIFRNNELNKCFINKMVGEKSNLDFYETASFLSIKKNIKKKNITVKDTMVGKIRKILIENKNAGLNDLKKVFGKITRSIIVTFYKESKEMYGDSNSLKKDRYTKVELAKEYFKNNPESTLRQACLDLGCNYGNIGSYLLRIRKGGETVAYKRNYHNKGKLYGKTKQIYEFFKKYPVAKTVECAKQTGINVDYVSNRRSVLRKKGML